MAAPGTRYIQELLPASVNATVRPGNSASSQGHQKKPPSVSAAVNLSSARHVTLALAPKAPSVSAGANLTPRAAIVLAPGAPSQARGDQNRPGATGRSLAAATPGIVVGVAVTPGSASSRAAAGHPALSAGVALIPSSARALVPSRTPSLSAGVALIPNSARALGAGCSSTDAVNEIPTAAAALARAAAPRILTNAPIVPTAAVALARGASPAVTAIVAVTAGSARAFAASRAPTAGIAQSAASARTLSRAYSPTFTATVAVTPGAARAVASAHGIPSAAQNIAGATGRAIALARPGSYSVSIQVRAASGLGLARGSSTLQRADGNLGAQAAIAWVYGQGPVLGLILAVTRSGTVLARAAAPVSLAAVGVPLLIGLADRLTTTPTVADMAFTVATADDRPSDSAELADQVAAVVVLTTEPYEIGS